MAVLNLRRNADGLRVVGDPPEEHVLTAQKIATELTHGATVRITIPTIEGQDDLVYDLVGFEEVESPDPDARLNFNAWLVQLVAP